MFKNKFPPTKTWEKDLKTFCILAILSYFVNIINKHLDRAEQNERHTYLYIIKLNQSIVIVIPNISFYFNIVSCKPQNVSAQLSCDTNSAIVTWELSDHVTHHSVQAVGTDGHHVNCSSSNNTCTLPALHCGQSYNTTVSALDGTCDNSNTLLSLQSG